MTGLDKMKSQILDEAKAAAEGKIAEAKAQAEETIRSAKEDAAKQTESILHKSKNDVSNYQERLESSIDLQKRTKILAAKQEVIAGVLEKARAKVEAMTQLIPEALMAIGACSRDEPQPKFSPATMMSPAFTFLTKPASISSIQWLASSR